MPLSPDEEMGGCFDPEGEIFLWTQEAAVCFGADSEATNCVRLVARSEHLI
jgi:hypothetical protein